MDIHVDIREVLEIPVWICYGFSDQRVTASKSQTAQKVPEHTSMRYRNSFESIELKVNSRKKEVNV